MTDNESEVARLRAKLREAEQAEQQAAREAWANVQPGFDYSIEWVSKHVFRCHRVLDAATLDQIQRLPEANRPYWASSPRAEGMAYLLIGNYLAAVGGGTLVLVSKPDESTDPFDHEPRLLSDEEAAALRRGVVPEALQSHRRKR